MQSRKLPDSVQKQHKAAAMKHKIVEYNLPDGECNSDLQPENRLHIQGLPCTTVKQAFKQCLDHMLLLAQPEGASVCLKGTRDARWDQKATRWQEQKYLLGIAPCRVVSLQLSRVMSKGAGSASLATALLEINAHTSLKQSFIRALLL